MSDSDGGDDEEEFGVLRNKRHATQYQILVEIAERQPAVNQREIADAIGITAQAVSDYLRDLVDRGHVRKHGRGRYEVTKEGVDWLITRTEELRGFVDHVSTDVIGQVEVETALASGDVAEGETVSLSMVDGILRARAGDDGNATAVAVTDARAGTDVGVTNFEGVIDYEVGTVTILSIPGIREGGGRAVDTDRLRGLADGVDLLAVAGVEAIVAVEAAGLEPDVRFGSAAAVPDAATKGLDVLLVAPRSRLSTHTDRLREQTVSYEVVDATE